MAVLHDGRARLRTVTFSLPDDLSRACLARLGVGAPATIDEVSRLLERLGQAVPSGSTAKNEAIDRGEVPPGADPAAVVTAWLERPGLGWSCWASSTLLAALVNGGGELQAEVVATRRVDHRSAPVDFHSAVEITDGRDRWITDPYFGFGPIVAPGGDSIRPGSWAEAFEDDRVWRINVGAAWGRGIVRYRSVTTPLTAGDVEAFCRVSVTHSGVGRRDRVELARPDGQLTLSTARDGTVRLRRWRAGPDEVWGATCDAEELDDWQEGERRVAELALSVSARRVPRR